MGVDSRAGQSSNRYLPVTLGEPEGEPAQCKGCTYEPCTRCHMAPVPRANAVKLKLILGQGRALPRCDQRRLTLTCAQGLGRSSAMNMQARELEADA